MRRRRFATSITFSRAIAALLSMSSASELPFSLIVIEVASPCRTSQTLQKFVWFWNPVDFEVFATPSYIGDMMISCVCLLTNTGCVRLSTSKKRGMHATDRIPLKQDIAIIFKTENCKYKIYALNGYDLCLCIHLYNITRRTNLSAPDSDWSSGDDDWVFSQSTCKDRATTLHLCEEQNM